jgi:hypothetical protein
MHIVDFLDMVNMVQVTKRCMGEDCPDVNAQVYEGARAVDKAVWAHEGAACVSRTKGGKCRLCAAIHNASDGLKSRLKANGIEVPEVLISPIV